MDPNPDAALGFLILSMATFGHEVPRSLPCGMSDPRRFTTVGLVQCFPPATLYTAGMVTRLSPFSKKPNTVNEPA